MVLLSDQIVHQIGGTVLKLPKGSPNCVTVLHGEFGALQDAANHPKHGRLPVTVESCQHPHEFYEYWHTDVAGVSLEQLSMRLAAAVACEASSWTM